MTSVDLNENSVTGIPDNIQTVGGKKMHALDDVLSDVSENPIQNKAIKAALDALDTKIDGKSVEVDGYTIKKGVDGKLYGVGYTQIINGSTKGEVFNVFTGGRAPAAGGNTATGRSSHAEGSYTTASGDDSHAQGYQTTAYGEKSHSEGGGTNRFSTTTHGTTLANIITASKTTPTSIAFGNYSHVEGCDNIAGLYGHAEGYCTVASGDYCHTEGRGTVADGDYSHAEGRDTKASAWGSHAEGEYTNATGPQSHAEGYQTTASYPYAHAEGSYNTASGYSAHAEGSSNRASADSSHAEGYNTTASGYYSHAEGYYTTSSGQTSHAEGYMTTASSSYSHAEGYYTVASGEYSHAEGSYTTTYGYYSHTEGARTLAYGNHSHAEGYGSISVSPTSLPYNIYDLASFWASTYNINIAYGNSSHSEGSNTAALGSFAHAEGERTLAYGNQTHSEGQYTAAFGHNSHAEGGSTYIFYPSKYGQSISDVINVAKVYPTSVSYGIYSHVEGRDNIANDYSHAEGYSNIATGYYAHTEGSNNTTGGNCSHVSGAFNNLNGLGGAFMTGSLNDVGLEAYASFTAGQRNRVNRYSHAIGRNLKAFDGCHVIGEGNRISNMPGSQTGITRYHGTTDRSLLNDRDRVIINKDLQDNVISLILSLGGTNSSLTSNKITEVKVNNVSVSSQYYSISNTGYFSNSPDLSKINGYYLTINVNGFTVDPDDEYIVEVHTDYEIGDEYIFAVGNGMLAEEEDCDDMHYANALAVTYDGTTKIQNDITFKYKDANDVKHRISAQKIVDALISLGINISDLEILGGDDA